MNGISREGKIYLLTGFLLLYIVVPIIFEKVEVLFLSHRNQVQTPILPPTVLDDSITKNGSVQWRTYVNKKYGFAFAYPPEWDLGRDIESSNNGDSFHDVTLSHNSLFGPQSFDMQVSRRNPNKLTAEKLLKSAGATRTYSPYGTIAGAEAISSDGGGGGHMTINFTNEDVFFNIDLFNVGLETTSKIFDTFTLSTTAGDSEKLAPAFVPSAIITTSPTNCTPSASGTLVTARYKNWHTYADKEHCLAFMYPQTWTMGSFDDFPYPVMQIDLDKSVGIPKIFKLKSDIGMEAIGLGISASNPNRDSIQDLLKKIGMHRDYKPFGKIANVDAVISSGGMGPEVLFTKGTYLFEIFLTGIEPDAFQAIVDSFVVLLPEPLNALPETIVATSSKSSIGT